MLEASHFISSLFSFPPLSSPTTPSCHFPVDPPLFPISLFSLALPLPPSLFPSSHPFLSCCPPLSISLSLPDVTSWREGGGRNLQPFTLPLGASSESEGKGGSSSSGGGGGVADTPSPLPPPPPPPTAPSSLFHPHPSPAHKAPYGTIFSKQIQPGARASTQPIYLRAFPTVG